MSEIFINKARACALTGHRFLYQDFSILKTKKIFKTLIKEGFDTFLIGMAIGFDTEAFKILEVLRKKYPIKLIACIPCENQDLKFNEKQKKEYKKLLESADERVLISKEYTEKCMQQRNEFMVDNCSCLVAYLKKDYGGTAKTVKYAEKNAINIIYL